MIIKQRLNRISIVLDEFNFSQKDLAIFLQVSNNTVSRWCRNINQPDLVKVYEIARFFRIDMIRLIEPTSWENEKGSPAYKLYLEEKIRMMQAQKKSTKKVNKLVFD
ncbi:helix-turn-helix protein [compost metagenome]